MSRNNQPLVVTPGWGGWVEARWHAGRPDEIVAYVRCELDGLDMRMAELRMYAPHLHLYRALPLSRIENAVNADANVRAELGLHSKQDPGPDLPAFFELRRSTRGTRLYRLRRPTTRRLGNDFYAAVARAYTDAVAVGSNPRKQLAEDSATPADTVARWIGEARKRGYLPPAEPGKVSASVFTKSGGGVTGMAGGGEVQHLEGESDAS